MDSEETRVEERWDSDNETVKSTMPKATVAGESESLNKSLEEQRLKSPIAFNDIDEGLGLGSEDFGGSPKTGEKQKKPIYKKKEKVVKPMEKRAIDIENLIAGKKVPAASSSKSPITSPAAKKQKTSSTAEHTELPTDAFNDALDRVLKKLKKGKIPVAEASTPKVTVDSDVMTAVNQKLADMMKIINQQQAEIEQLRNNDKKMLDVVETSHENQEALEAKIKQLQKENKKLLKHEQRNTRRFIALKEENKKLKESNKNMDNLIKDLYSRAPQLKEGEEDKEQDEEQVDFEPSDNEEEDDEDLDEDAGNAPKKKKKKDDGDDDGSNGESGDGGSSAFDDDDDDDDTDKYKYEKRGSGKEGES